MKFKKKILNLTLFIFAISITQVDVFADSKDSISIDNIFTKEDGLWHPGRKESKDFSITNNVDKDISLETINISLDTSKNYETNEILNKDSQQFREMSEKTTVKLMSKENTLFKGKLSELCKTEVIKLNKEIPIESKQSEEFNIVIDMDESIGNDSQSIQNEFNVGVTYKINSDSIVGGGNDGNNGGDNGGNTGSNEDKLPQTGGIINSMSLVAIGAIAVGTGVALNRKSDEGGKHHE